MKFLKWFLIVLVAIVLLFAFVLMPYGKKQTKKHSPETTVVYSENGLDVTVAYSSPSKKGRVIFGELVPYNVVWRTGANEPTTFTTKTTVEIGSTALKAGTYSLWTKPSKNEWTVYFNDEVPDWGVTLMSGGKETTRDAEHDVASVVVPSERMPDVIENFTISFNDEDGLNMVLAWDQTMISVPIKN